MRDNIILSALVESGLLELLMSNRNDDSSNAYFSSNNDRFVVFELCKNLTKYLAEKNIPNIAFVDRSARAAWVGVYNYWNKYYPDRKRPHIYFFNPDGFVKFGCKKNFKQSFTKLMDDKEKPLVIFDTCCHSGGTLKGIIKVLLGLGFKDVRPITANSPDFRSGIHPACEIDERLFHFGCAPFGGADLVDKTKKVICKLNKTANRNSGLRIRAEIKEIMQTS